MLGSDIAKSGFEQEEAFKNSFNQNLDFKKQICDFIKMPYSAVAYKIPGMKHDIQIASPHSFDYKNIQIKRYKGDGFNQVDKRFHTQWHGIIPDLFIDDLSKFTGASNWPSKTRSKPCELSQYFIDNLHKYQKEIIHSSLFKHSNVDYFFCFNEKQKLTMYTKQDLLDLVLAHPVEIKDKRTTINLGQYVTWQRKGGDSGAITATMTQTKMKTGKVCEHLLLIKKAKSIEYAQYRVQDQLSLGL